MNSILKNSNSLIRSSNLIKGNILRFPKFNFFSLNKPKIINSVNFNNTNSSDLIKIRNLNLIKFNKNYFSDKKDKEPEKKSEEEEKKKTSSSNEDPKNDPNDKKDKDDKNKEKKNNDEKNPSEFFKIFKDQEFIKDNIMLYMMIIGGFTIFIFSKYSSSENKIDNLGLQNLIATRDLSSIDFYKDTQTNEVTGVFHKKSDNSQQIMNITNIQSFLQSLEQMQLQMGIQVNQFVPVKWVNEKYEKKYSVESIIALFTVGYGLGNLIKRGNISYLKKMGSKGGSQMKKKSDKSSDKNSRFNFGNFMDVKKSIAKEYGAEENIDIKFNDVAGMEQAKREIVEFVDFLKNPEKYKNLGAKIPKGALLVGPPGTGKTLLAKAVAGEAGVPFFATSGSDFVEMFVGVGASRVRDLFKKAKDKSPSILFIDEIDAVGKKRGGKFGGHDERDNTLNQLLVEMDGFGTESNVIVLAATNRADILDSALLRPGRFDRQVEVSLPDRKDRAEIVKIYLNKIKIDKSKSIDEYAMRLSTLTPGFSGADLANLVNEAAIISARENKQHVDSDSFEKASERIMAGLETKRLTNPKEKRTVAYHEAGHAVIGWFLENANPLVKVTIIPRSKGSLGFTQYIPDDLNLYTKEYLLDTICVLLGGRMAEEFFFKQITSGASDDLQKVSGIAYGIVTKYGMSDLGLRAFSQDQEYMAKPFSPETESKIDEEVNKIIEECAEKTRAMIRTHESEIKKLAEALHEKETLDIIDIIDILGQRPFPLGESLSDYLKEIEIRKEEAKKRHQEEELKRIEEEEKKIKEEEERKLKECENANNKTDETKTSNASEEKIKEEVSQETKENKKE